MAKSSVVTVMNMKGGVGKTTITGQLSALIAKTPSFKSIRKVLVIDFDPQFNLSQMLVEPKRYFDLMKEHKNVEHILTDLVKPAIPLELPCPSSDVPPMPSDIAVNVFEDRGRKLDIVCANLELMHLALGTGAESLTHMSNRFSTFIVQAKKDYDLILIDCHPCGSLFTKCALENSDHILIPITGHPFTLRGVKLLQEFISAIAFQNPKKHLLFNNVSGDTATLRAAILKDRDFKDCDISTALPKNDLYRSLNGGKGYIWDTESSSSQYQAAFLSLTNIANELITKVTSQE